VQNGGDERGLALVRKFESPDKLKLFEMAFIKPAFTTRASRPIGPASQIVRAGCEISVNS
jgi:hypothetical protein